MKRFIYVLTVFFMLSVSVFAASQQISSTTAATLIDRAEVWLNDSDNGFWQPGELLQWLNEGMIDIVLRTHCLQATEDINLVANTVEYSITSTYLTIKDVVYVNASSVAKGLKKGNVAMVGNVSEDWNDATDKEPMYWYDFAGKIGVFPVLSAVTTEKVTLYLITRPTAIASGANVTTPAIYDSALVIYMVAQAWLKDLKMNKYLQTMALYNSEMSRIRQDLNELPVQVVE